MRRAAVAHCEQPTVSGAGGQGSAWREWRLPNDAEGSDERSQSSAAILDVSQVRTAPVDRYSAVPAYCALHLCEC